MQDFPSLAGHLLIAMPALNDPNFENTVTLICEHSEEGAMGITINRPTDLMLEEVFSQLAEYQALDPADRNPAIASSPVLLGGPVSPERGFVIHRDPGDWEATLAITNGIHVTMSRDILTAMSGGDGPQDATMVLGYAGWEAEQLEQEIRANAWLTTQATSDIVFAAPFETRWDLAAATIGVSRDQLSAGPAGHA